MMMADAPIAKARMGAVASSNWLLTHHVAEIAINALTPPINASLGLSLGAGNNHFINMSYRPF
jgi:hypothetical protein